MTRAFVLMFLFVGGGAVPLTGQHPTDKTAPGLGDRDGCTLCHSSHLPPTMDEGAYILKRGNGEFGFFPGSMTEVGPVSQSCLRCHDSAETRGLQPEFDAHSEFRALEGIFVGTGVAETHPIGWVPETGTLRSDIFDSGFSVLQRAPSSFDLTQSLDADIQIECTSCHDPHSREPFPLPETEERELCLTCHAQATYELSGHATVRCTGCHSVHAGHEGGLLRSSDSSALCQECHGFSAGIQGQDDALPGLFPVPDSHRTNPDHLLAQCVDCHGVHR